MPSMDKFVLNRRDITVLTVTGGLCLVTSAYAAFSRTNNFLSLEDLSTQSRVIHDLLFAATGGGAGFGMYVGYSKLAGLKLEPKDNPGVLRRIYRRVKGMVSTLPLKGFREAVTAEISETVTRHPRKLGFALVSIGVFTGGISGDIARTKRLNQLDAIVSEHSDSRTESALREQIMKACHQKGQEVSVIASAPRTLVCP